MDDKFTFSKDKTTFRINFNVILGTLCRLKFKVIFSFNLKENFDQKEMREQNVQKKYLSSK